MPTPAISMFKRISLELFHQYPGQTFLRLEPWEGPVIMVRVLPGDIAAISFLGERDEGTGKRITGIVTHDNGNMQLQTGDR